MTTDLQQHDTFPVVATAPARLERIQFENKTGKIGNLTIDTRLLRNKIL